MRRLRESFNHRAWGVIPLLLFALKCWQYRPPADTYQLVWFCTVSNLVMGIAILLRVGNLVFICSVLLTIGLPIWIFDFIINGDFHVFSVFTHVVSPLLGFAVAKSLGWTKHAVWQTLIYYLMLQVLARLITPALLNINVAFDIYAPVKQLFPNFAVYSAVNMLGLTAFAYAMHRLLRAPRRSVC